MTQRLKDKVALVLGAGSIGPGWGNGKATAVLLARQGAQVCGVDLSAKALAATTAIMQAEGLGDRWLAFTCSRSSKLQRSSWPGTTTRPRSCGRRILWRSDRPASAISSPVLMNGVRCRPTCGMCCLQRSHGRFLMACRLWIDAGEENT